MDYRSLIAQVEERIAQLEQFTSDILPRGME